MAKITTNIDLQDVSSIGLQNLQQVTDIGNATNKQVSILLSPVVSDSPLERTALNVINTDFNTNSENYVGIGVQGTGSVGVQGIGIGPYGTGFNAVGGVDGAGLFAYGGVYGAMISSNFGVGIDATSNESYAIDAFSNLGVGIRSVSNEGAAIVASSSESVGIIVDSNDSVAGIFNINNDLNNIVIFQKDLVTKAYITYEGDFVSNKFIKLGASPDEILAGDGSVITAGSGINISDGVISSTGGGGSQNLQEVLTNGNTANTGVILNIGGTQGVLINLEEGAVGLAVSTIAGGLAAYPLIFANEYASYFQVDNGGNLFSLGFLEAYSFVKSGGLSTEYLMADGSVTTGGGGITDLGYTPSSTNGIVTSSTGTDATIPLANSTNAGLLTPAEKTKLSGIAAGAEVNVNADWNATSGDAQILNKPTIPSAITQTSQLTNNGADGVNPFITALDIPTAGQAGTLVREVKNMTGATLVKGTVVYISGANGNKPLVSKAQANTDALSARTFGLLQSDILNNGLGNCVIIGDLTGVDTSAFADGTQLYLSGTTAGTYTSTKPVAPIHLVYIGKVTRSHPTLGQIEVGIQNGYELDEIHDVLIVTPTNNQLLVYETTSDLWKNKSIATALGYTPANDSNVVHKTVDETIAGIKTFSSNPKIPINYGNSSIGSLIIDNGLGEIQVASNYVYPNLTELSYLKGITSSVQNQINSKQATLTSSIFGSFGNALGLKSFLQDNDSVVINDSSDSNNAKKITWSLIWTAYLKNKADALYQPIGVLSSQSAYTILANNTNANAVPSTQAFKSIAQQTYTGTIVVTATTSPSGATNHSYTFTQVGKLVTLRINLDWATTGAVVSAIACELPSDCPTPELPTGVSATGDVIVYGTGTMSANRQIVAAMGIMALRLKTSSVFELVVTRTGASFNKAYFSIQYFTA